MDQSEIDLRLGRKTFLNQMWDTSAARIITTGLLIALTLYLAWAARETLTLFLFAILFAYFLSPPVGLLEKPLRGRGKAILAVYVTLIGLLVGVGFIAGPAIGDESRQLITSLPSLLDRLGTGELIRHFGQDHHIRPDVVAQMQSFMVGHRSEILGYGSVLGSKLAAPAQHIWWLFLIPILSLFFLRQGDRIAHATVALGRSTRERIVISSMLSDVNVMLGSYIRAQIILALLTLTAYTIVLNLMRVPYAFILGPIGGFLEFIPVVGPAVGAAGITVIAILAGYPHTLWLIFFLGCWRIMQDYVNAPRIMGRQLEINPLLQIFAVLVGGEVGGVVGALISVPAVATLRIIARHVRDHRSRIEDPLAPASSLASQRAG